MKTYAKKVAFILIVLLGIFSPALAQPTLTIAPAGNQSILCYSYSLTNYILQSTTNLATPNWVTANDAVPVMASTVSNSLQARFFRLIYTNPPAGMALIPAGSFTMGNSIGDSDITDANQTNIYVSALYMDTNLVSYGLWTNVYAYATANGYGFVNAGAGKNNEANQPIQKVDWYDCVKWCNARSQLAGLTPVYYTNASRLPTQVYRTGETTNVYVNWAANGFRLPTEAEWEKAARGGLSGRRFPWGNRIDENQANYNGYPANFSYDFGPQGYNPIGSNGGTFPTTSPVGMGMAYTTWRGMCMSGVGIGMSRLMVNLLRPIQPDRQMGSTVCFAAAIGALSPTARGAPFASATTPP